MVPSLSTAVEGFLLDRAASGRSDHTLSDYKISLKRMCAYFGENARIDEITSRQLNEYFVWLKEEYVNVNKMSGARKKLKAKTLVNNRTNLQTFWSWVSLEFNISNPFRVGRIDYKKPPILPFTEEEIKKLLAACENSVRKTKNGLTTYSSKRPTRLRDKAIIMILFDSGVRVSELCGLRFGDLDLGNLRMKVIGKGEKERTIYIGKNAAQHIWKYRASRFPDGEPDPEDFVFSDEEGLRPLTRNAVRLLLDRIGKKAGVSNCHPHRFRHTFACTYLRNGGDALTLQEALGHETLDMTKRYVKFNGSDAQRVHRRASPGDNLLKH